MRQDNSSFFWTGNALQLLRFNQKQSFRRWRRRKKDLNVHYLAVCRTAAIYFGSDSSTVIFATDRKVKMTEIVSSTDDPFQCISSVHIYGRSLLPLTVQYGGLLILLLTLLSHNSRFFSHYSPFLCLSSPAERKREITGGLSHLWLTAPCSALKQGDITLTLVSLLGCHTHTHGFWRCARVSGIL